MVMVVGCYLLSNSVTTIINVWEFVDGETFKYKNFYAYLYASDIAALVSCICYSTPRLSA
ncbi:unnamed protein product [Anisakis simplex]|uniref:Uncharacterized protein n=1 Tax=Anisakis simplex TaxID=6269 RepID=A0A3P6P274_ANISI|nr:unnamed protein product [Anisakis simplex]